MSEAFDLGGCEEFYESTRRFDLVKCDSCGERTPASRIHFMQSFQQPDIDLVICERCYGKIMDEQTEDNQTSLSRLVEDFKEQVVILEGVQLELNEMQGHILAQMETLSYPEMMRIYHKLPESPLKQAIHKKYICTE